MTYAIDEGQYVTVAVRSDVLTFGFLIEQSEEQPWLRARTRRQPLC